MTEVFIDILKQIDDSFPFFRGLVGEYGVNIKTIEFLQPKRRAGKSKMNFSGLYNTAINGITSYTKIGIRFGMFFSILMILIGILLLFSLFLTGINLIFPLMLFLFGINIFFISFIGEYIIAINIRVMHHPLVIEEERINF